MPRRTLSSGAAFMLAAVAASLIPTATTLPPSNPVPGNGMVKECTPVDLWSKDSCMTTQFCDAGQACSCPQPAPGDEGEAGLKICRLGTYCACSGPGEAACQALKSQGDACSDSEECRFGECVDPSGGAGKRVCTPRGGLHCGLTGYACGDNFYCMNSTSCQERKNVDMDCGHSNECRGGLVCMSGDARGGRSCQPLFGRGWDQPCSQMWGECAWGMRCDAGRCALVSANEVKNCTSGGDALCGPYSRCMCSQGGGVCSGVVNSDCEHQFDLLVRCLATNNCPIHDANFSALADRPSSCVSDRCAAEWTVAQCCKVKGHEGLFAFGDETLLGSGCDTSVPASAGLVVMIMILISCSSVSYIAKRKYSSPSSGYVRVPGDECDDVDDFGAGNDCRYSVLVGANEQAFISEKGAELHAPRPPPSQKKRTPVRRIEEADDQVADYGSESDEGGVCGRDTAPAPFVQGGPGLFSDL